MWQPTNQPKVSTFQFITAARSFRAYFVNSLINDKLTICFFKLKTIQPSTFAPINWATNYFSGYPQFCKRTPPKSKLKLQTTIISYCCIALWRGVMFELFSHILWFPKLADVETDQNCCLQVHLRFGKNLHILQIHLSGRWLSL